MNCPVMCANDIARLIPKDIQDIDARIANMKEITRQQVSAIIAVNNAERNFANTARAIDEIGRQISFATSPIDFITLVHPDKALRDHARDVVIAMQPFIQEEFARNSRLFAAFKAYYEGPAHAENLSQEQRYFIDELMLDWKRGGMLLPEEQLKKIRELSTQIGQLCLDFQRNIDQDETTLTFTAQQLRGVPEQILASLTKDKAGNYIVRMEPPVINAICKHAHEEQTRHDAMHAFANRAYPQNNALLKQIIAKRQELAQMLGYPNIATLSIEDQMAESPERVKTFLAELANKTKPVQEAEIKRLLDKLPASIKLTDKGLIKPWDLPYLKEWYKQQFLHLDSNVVAQYFPVEHVVEQTMAIYQTFLGLQFKEVEVTGLWDKEIRCVAICNEHGTHQIGFLLLDLYPRQGKFSHACNTSIISGQLRNGRVCPSVTCIVANFPKKTTATPALLPYADVRTFFHEFGHAMHAAVAIASLYGQSGLTNKADFFEIPSQLMEKWLEDKDILRRLSKHYQANNPLPDTMVDQLVSIEKFDIGDFTRRQIGLAQFSLTLFDGTQHEIDALYAQIMQASVSNVMFDRSMHVPASFGHLTGYGACYYSYLWSNAISCDVFETIKKQGLLNPDIGRQLVTQVLAKGATTHPMNLLKDFLGREPNQDAFLHYLGLPKA